MTFDDWAKENWYLIDVKANAAIIWKAATIAEREACHKECLQMLKESNNIAASVCASRIERRSNH